MYNSDMYSQKARQDTLEKIVSICKSINDVEGVILVGSGGDQFPDKWADIDLSVVVYPASETKSVWDILNVKFRSSFKLITLGINQYGENDYISVLLLKNYLEVDVGVISLDNLEVKKDKWDILYEKQDKILKKMQQSSLKRRYIDPVQYVRHSVSNIGHHFRTFAVAINRNQPFRAIKELEDIRNLVVETWALQEGKVAKHFRDIDEADLGFRQKLVSTYPISFELDDLTTAFTNTFILFFKLAEEIDLENQEITSIKEEMKRLLEAFGIRK